MFTAFYIMFYFVVMEVHLGDCKLSPRVSQTQAIQNSLLLSSMNFTVNPCDDFYQYACGRWSHFNPIPEDRDSWNPLFVTEKRESEKIQKIVETPSDEQESGHAIRKAKDFYISCLNTSKINELGTTPLLEYLKKLGGWPAIDENWTDAGKDWLNLLAETRRLDQRVVFDSFVYNDLFDKTRYSLFVQFPYPGLSSRHSFLNGGSELDAYKILINDVLNVFKKDDHSKTVKEIIDLETEFAKIILDGSELGNILTTGNTITTLGDLQANFTNIDWMRYFSIVHGKTFESSERVLVMTIEFVTKLNDLIKSTPTKTMFNYLMWKIVRLTGESVGGEIETVFHNFKVAVSGLQNATPRREKCLQSSIQHFGNAVGYSYVKIRFDKDSRKDAKHLLSLLKDSFRRLIDNAKWVDETSKTAARTKLEKMGMEVGYPDFVLEQMKVDEFYDTVTINTETYFTNILEVQRLQNHLQTILIGQPVNKRVWPGSFLKMVASYAYPQQTIFASAPMLQTPMYSKEYAKYMNFGGIATILAHEISHGFDSVGMGFDADGQVNNWFGNESLAIYRSRETCFVEKYGSYSYNGTNLNGKNLLRETIADDVGIKTSFNAYKLWLQENQEEIISRDERITKYNLTKEKLFFISSAQLNCMGIRPEAWTTLISMETHPLRQFRVNGIMSNSVDFSEVFECPAGSAMNPITKCSIW